MKIRLFENIQKYVLACSAALMLFACTNDAWDDHYQAAMQEKPTETLWQQLQTQDTLSEFRRVLENVRVTNGNKFTDVTYANLLGKQYFTVFAPKNGSFNADSLIAECATLLGNKKVEQMFVNSHLSRTPYSLAPNVDKKALMLNGKYLPFVDSTLADVRILSNSNIIAKNGLIHTMNAPVPYVRNVYEMLVDLPEFSGMGNFLLQGQKDSLDEVNSIEAGINEDGVMVFIDSVFIRKNDLLGRFGWINSEDSTYWFVAPTQAGWDAAKNKVSKYFEFRHVVGADSLKNYWTNFNLIKDLVFNPKLQKAPNDSLTSNQYSTWNPDMHVFYNPYSDSGILANAVPIKASNGVIYKTPNWNFNIEDVFFSPIVVEAERDRNLKTLDATYFNKFVRQKYADSISANGYLEINPISSTKQTDVTFYLPNTLSGKYDICVVLLPKTVYNAASTDIKKNRFTAIVEYQNLDNSVGKVTCKGKEGENKTFFVNDPLKVDTITLTTLSLPTCNYNQNNVKVTVRLTSVQIRTNERNTYTHQFYIDCFYLKPRQD